MVATENFNSESTAPMTVFQALDESVKLYGKIERGTDQSLQQACTMVRSAAFKILTELAPIESENLATGAMEKVPHKDRGEFEKSVNYRDGATNLRQVYPEAAAYYEGARDALVSGTGVQDPNRKEWQECVWRPYQAIKDSLSEEARVQRLTHILREDDDPALRRIGKVAPWSEIDVRQALVEGFPEKDRSLYAQIGILDTRAFAQLQEECPAVAKYYRAKIADKFGLSAEVLSFGSKESNPGIGM